MGLSRIEQFCAALTAELGSEITYGEASGIDFHVRTNDEFAAVYKFYSNREPIKDVIVSDLTLWAVKYDTSATRGAKVYMSFNEYVKVMSKNIRKSIYNKEYGINED